MAKLKKQVVEYYSFYCPGCKHNHSYAVDSDGSGWKFNGNLNCPSFTPSLLNQLPVTIQSIENGKVVNKVEMKERCHLYVTNGKIQFLSDCSHEFAGQTVELPEI